MKKNILIALTTVLIIACKDKSKSTAGINADSLHQIELNSIQLTSKDSQIINENYNVAQAKRCADTIFIFLNRSVNRMAKTNDEGEKHKAMEEMNYLAEPYQKRLDSLKALLPENRVKVIDEYRQELLTKVKNGTF